MDHYSFLYLCGFFLVFFKYFFFNSSVILRITKYFSHSKALKNPFSTKEKRILQMLKNTDSFSKRTINRNLIACKDRLGT